MEIPFEEVTLESINFDDEPVAFDTETCGLYGKIRLAQFYQASWDKVKLVNYPNPFELAAKLDEAKQIMHNAHYDIACVQANSGTRYEPKTYEDTFYLSRLHFYNKEKFSLDAVMTYVLGYDPYDKMGIDKAVMQKINWDIPVLAHNQKVYAAIDVYFLLDVYDVVKGHEDDTSYKLDMLSLHYALDFQNNGMPVLRDEVPKVYKENLAEIEGYNMPINVNSYQQVRPYIGSNNSDALGLATLALQGNDRAKNVNTVRKLIKQNSFLNKFSVNEDYIYGKFLPSARSGRFTSKDQNLQQIPRKLKKVFGFDTESGKVLLYSDYAQLEMRCIAAITGEKRMDKILREGGDLHNFTTEMIFGKDYEDKQRQIAKTANFNLLYGGGVNMFRNILIKDAGLLLPEAEVATVKKKWLNLWPAIANWQKAAGNAWRHGKAWQTPFGRRYTAKLMTDQCNIMNQGFGAEVAKLAMHYMMPVIEEEWADKGVALCDFVHDSYIFECPADEEIYVPLAEFVAECMQRAWFEAVRTGVDLKVRDLPMPVDVFVGYNWGRIEKDYIYKFQLEGMKTYELL